MSKLFLAPLFKCPLITSSIEGLAQERIVSVKFSKNRNSVEILFKDHHHAQAALEHFSLNFPELTAKLTNHSSSQPSIPIPLPAGHPDRPPGLTIVPDFVSPILENHIVAQLDMRDWDTTIRRRVQHFGYQFLYSQLKASASQPFIPFPDFLSQLLDHPDLHAYEFDQITVNEYVPGIGIASHCDTHSAFSHTIAVISLLNPVVMEFVRMEDARKVAVTIPPRSLMFMQGESRYGWRHAIASRKSDLSESGEYVPRGRRVSLTFRRLESKECNCEYPSLCDSQGADMIRPRRMNSG